MNSLTKTPDEIAVMQEGGRKIGMILDQLLDMAMPGVRLLTIEKQAQKLINQAGGTPSFQTVEDYQWATCLCVNEAVVHGIPTDYILVEGDVLTIDIGMLYMGFHTDTAWTKIVSRQSSVVSRQTEKERFLKIGEEALNKATLQAKAGNHIGHISEVIQKTVEGGGYSIVRSLVGHGVGKELHEAPHIPGVLKGEIYKTPELLAGQTIAIEIIYAMGSGEVVYDRGDGWTIGTKDRSVSAVFEHSIAVTETEPIVLTKGEK